MAHFLGSCVLDAPLCHRCDTFCRSLLSFLLVLVDDEWLKNMGSIALEAAAIKYIASGVW